MIATVAWGSDGLRLALERGHIPVIVDVLRFSSTVTTAVANGFTILPTSTREAARSLAAATGAAQGGLSPLDYVNPREPQPVVLVSSNGASLARSLPPGAFGFIACFLNARTAGRLLATISRDRGTGIVLVPAGEALEDQEDDLEHRRFAIEDYLGCGAVLSELKVDLDREAAACRESFLASKRELGDVIRNSPSGRYLADRGRAADLSHCVQTSIYEVLPVIRDGTIVAWSPEGAGRTD